MNDVKVQGSMITATNQKHKIKAGMSSWLVEQ